MDYGHPLVFGAAITPTADDPSAPVALVRVSEQVGLDLVTVAERPDEPARLDTWTLLGWMAGQTDRIHLAPTVLGLPLRQPAVLARAAASLDLLSHGRLELGLGAGQAWDALEAMGTSRLTPDGSVDALEEAMAIIRGIWASSRTPLRFNGAHHHVDGAARGPAPEHDIPVWVGGDGPRTLELVGRLADGWVIPAALAGPAELPRAQSQIDAAAQTADRDPREIRRILTVTGRFQQGGVGLLVGPAEQWVEQLLRAVVENGVGTLLLATDDASTIERYAAEVVPALREAVAAERAHRGVTTASVVSSAIRVQRHPGINYDTVPPALAGDAVEPGQAAYARVRSNYLRGGSPGLVLRPADTVQVSEAIRWARTQPVALSVRSGGHGVSGRSTNHGGIVIDLGRLRDIEVLDVATRRVRIGPGARWGEVAAALQPRGWALTSGDSGGVGVGGLSTAGGIGFFAREHGLTIDHLRGVEMVLADGTVVRASETERPDLFWGVRGAGFALGIATSFEFEVDEVGDIGFGQLVHDVTADPAGFLERWGVAVESSPRDTTSFLVMGQPRDGRLVAQTMNVVDSDDPETVVSRLEHLAVVAPLVGQAAQIMPYDALVVAPPRGHDGQGEPVSRSGLIEHLTPEFTRDAAALLHSGAVYFFQIRSLGGATGDVDPGATAFAHRAANFQVLGMGSSHRRLDPLWDRMLPHYSGTYLSFDSDARPERIHDAFPPETLARLRQLKRRYDPDLVFRDNFAITPDPEGAERTA